MAWKDILVFADGSSNGLARTQIAATLAMREPACRLTACVPVVLPYLPYGPLAASLDDLVERAYQVARDDGGRAVAAIREAAPTLIGDRLTVEAPEVGLGDAARLAGVLGHCADLIVVGQPIAEDMTSLDDLVLEGALFRSGRPCLVLPRWEAPREVGSSVLVAWSGTPQSARAVHDAMPLLERAATVRLFHAGEGAEREGEGPFALSRLARHLARHGVAVEEPRPARLDAGIGEVLLTEAHTMGADLLVMGGYGHGRLRESVFGGATRAILHGCDVAVLMAH